MSSYYVDPVSGSDIAGQGTSVGTAYKTVQFALDDIGGTHGRDATNGDQVNVMDSGDDVLLSSLSFVAYGTPAAASPIILRGFTAIEGDGGIGGISGGGLIAIAGTATPQNVYWIDLHLHNTGGFYIIDGSTSVSTQVFYNCEFDNGGGGIEARSTIFVDNCYFHNLSNNGIFTQSGNGCVVLNCVFENGVNLFSSAIAADGSYSYIAGNIFSLSGGSRGINTTTSTSVISGNTIRSVSGTAEAILVGTNRVRYEIVNNLIVGFSGVGGIGISQSSGGIATVKGHNVYYNNSTNESLSGSTIVDLGNDVVLLSDPFTNAGGGDFGVSVEVRRTGWPTAFKGISTNQYLDSGAAQREEITTRYKRLTGVMAG